MTDSTRALLEQALSVINSFELQDGRLWYSKLEPEQIDVTCSVIRAELAKPDENGGKTGWPPGMLQDDDSKLSKWLSRRGNAGQLAAQAAHQAALAKPAQGSEADIDAAFRRGVEWGSQVNSTLEPTPTPATAPSELTGQGAALYGQLIAAVKRLLSAQDEPERFGCVGPSPSEIAHRNLMQLIKHVCTGIDSPPAPSWHDAPEIAALKAQRDVMLDALKAFSDYVHTEQCSADGKVTYSDSRIQHLVFKARDAIAKAEGGVA